MDNKKIKTAGFTLIEILIVLAILLLIGSWVIRFMYAHEMIEWENDLYRSIGLHPGLVRFVIGVFVIFFFGEKVLKRNKEIRREKANRLK